MSSDKRGKRKIRATKLDTLRSPQPVLRKEALMDKCIKLSALLGYLFDREDLVRKAERIMTALLEARCARLTMIAEKMPGPPAANYKAIQRFLAGVDLKGILQRLFQEEAEF